MSKLSVIIPSFNEPYLGRTVRDLLDKAVGDIEIFVNVDGNLPKKLIKDRRVSYAHNPTPLGMRGGINLGLKKTKSEFIMKIDAHCALAKGFDDILKRDCQENWLIIPRRYSLDIAKWQRDLSRPFRDYHYFAFPTMQTGFGMPCPDWPEITKMKSNNPQYNIDDTMGFQGSCWFTHRKYFIDNIGFLDDRAETYSTFAGDRLEIGLKYWLMDGEIKVDKNTWYAHLFKNKHFYDTTRQDRHFKKSATTWKSHRWAAKHWLNNQELGMRHTFQWLAEKFWPIPGWPEDRKLWKI